MGKGGAAGSAPEGPVRGEPAPSGRFAVLGAYMFVGIVTQMLWITFAPLPPCSTLPLCATSSNVAYLTAVFPLVFVAISIPVGYLVDARGFRVAVLLGAVFLAVSGVLRPFAPDFPVLLAFQAVGAVGQPFILNSVSKVVRGWFPPKEVAVATGLATLSIYLGLALGLGATPVIAWAIGVRPMFELYGALGVVALVVFAALGREPPGAVVAEREVTWKGVASVVKEPNILLLSALFLVGIGIFNAVANWIVPMLGSRGVGPDWAGVLGGVLIVGGIIGAIVVSGVADPAKGLKRPLLAAVAMAAVLWAVLGLLSGIWEEAAGLFVLGFFYMSALPLGLELSARSVPAANEGVANAVVWEFSQVGGFSFIFLFAAVAAAWGWGSTFFLSAGLCALMLGLGSRVRLR